MLSDDGLEDSIVLFNGDMFPAVTIEYDRTNNNTIVKGIDGEHEVEGITPYIHWVTIRSHTWFADCGDLLCNGVRPFEARSPYIDIKGEFSLEGASRVNEEPKYIYMFRSFGEVEVTVKGTK